MISWVQYIWQRFSLRTASACGWGLGHEHIVAIRTSNQPRLKYLSHHAPIRPPSPLPQNILLQFPRARLRQLFHNLHLPRHHEPTDATLMLGPLNHIVALQFPAGLHGDERFGPLAPVRIGDCDDGGFEDGGVRGEHGFEGYGGDVFAACGGGFGLVGYMCMSVVGNYGYVPLMIISFARSRIWAAPSGCHTARSPVCSTPPRKSLRVASASL